MTAVIEFADVTVRRGSTTMLDQVNWTVEEDERWVILGPNGAGKTTLLQVAAAQIHPTVGVAGILGEVLGTVDVFDLRPRIGLTSAALAERIPRSELVQRRGRVRVVRRRWAAGARSTTTSTTTARPTCSSRSGRRTWPIAPSAPSARVSASGSRSPVR